MGQRTHETRSPQFAGSLWALCLVAAKRRLLERVRARLAPDRLGRALGLLGLALGDGDGRRHWDGNLVVCADRK